MQDDQQAIEPSYGQMAIIGWREYVALPELGILEVKAKIDTGACSSALHAFDIETFEQNGKLMIRFKVHPYQRDTHRVAIAQAELVEQREVRNSGGQTQLRPVIRTMLELNDYAFPVELTLTNREAMGFRLLLGRQALRRRFLVDASRSFLHSSHKSAK